MFYSNSIHQTIHIFAIAKVLSYIKVNREVQVPFPVCSYFATITQHDALPSMLQIITLLQILLARGHVLNHPTPFLDGK